jgi:quercetin dioxygenase-like cupin family protein
LAPGASTSSTRSTAREDARTTQDIIGPVGGKTLIFVESAVGTPGAQTTVEVESTPFHGEMHLHPKVEEMIEVLRGDVVVRVDTDCLELSTGGSVVIPPGTRHTWSNESGDPVRVRIRFRPGVGIETYLRTTYGLHLDGKTDPTGKLALLQTAILCSDFRDAVIFELDPLRRAWLRFLAPVGRLVGYRSAYPEYRPDVRTDHT